MREIILYVAQSIDGYIAREDGSVDWLNPYNNSEFDFASFFDSIDICIMGRRTYEQIVYSLAPENWPYTGKEVIVLSSQKIEDENITSMNVDELLETVEHSTGKIWIVGGSMLLRFFLENNLIDKMMITTIPILLGKGISLFTQIDAEQTYKVSKVNDYSGLIEVTYER